jgi:transcriptional regulator with XRE-family HTH domain
VTPQEMKAIGARIRELRTRRAWTQEILARATNPPMMLKTIKSVEAGRRVTRSDTLRKIAAAFGVSVEALTTPPTPQVPPTAPPRSFVFIQPLEHALAAARGILPISRSLRVSPDAFLRSGLVLERAELPLVLSALTQHRYALVVGHPSSGKSFLATTIGAHWRQHDMVYISNVRTLSLTTVSAVLDELHQIPDNSLLIVEDIHTNPRAAELLFADCLPLKISILLTARPSFSLELSRHEMSAIANIETTNPECYFYIRASDIADSLISLFEEHSRRVLSSTQRSSLKRQAQGDLWLLNLFLKETPADPAEATTPFAALWRDVRGLADRHPHYIEILWVVAQFFKDEVSIHREFVVQHLRLPGVAIDFLLGQDWIAEDFPEPLLSFRHSSFARAIIEAISRHSHLALVSDRRWSATLLMAQYAAWDPDSVFRLVRQLRYDPSALAALMACPDFVHALASGLNNPRHSLYDAAHLLSDITRITDDETREAVLELIDVDRTVTRLNRETAINAIAAYLDGFPWMVDQSARSLVQQANEHASKVERLEIEPPSDRVGFCEWMMKWDTSKSFLHAVRNNFRRFAAGRHLSVVDGDLARTGFCSKSSETGQVILCGKTLISSPSPKSREILQRLDICRISDLCNRIGDAYAASHILHLFSWIDQDIGRTLVKGLNIQTLLDNAKATGDMSLLNFFCWSIWSVDQILLEQDILPLLSSGERDRMRVAGWLPRDLF